MQKLMKAMHKNEKGFTLVELMVVVVIIGILVAIAIPIFQAVQARAELRACNANSRTIEGAKAIFNAQTLVEQTASNWPGDYLEGGIPLCPTLGVYTNVLPTDAGRATCSIHGTYGTTP